MFFFTLIKFLSFLLWYSCLSYTHKRCTVMCFLLKEKRRRNKTLNKKMSQNKNVRIKKIEDHKTCQLIIRRS